MSRQIAGFITEWDTWGRFRITYPRVRGGTDAFNTETQLQAYGRDREGWCPAKKKSFIAKPHADKNGMVCFAYTADGKRVTNFSDLVQHNAVFEVEFMPFAGGDPGWWIRVASVRLVD
jgi:hypothetical protein